MDKEYYQNNKKKLLLQMKEYYQKNRKRILLRVKQYQIKEGILNGKGSGNYIRTPESNLKRSQTEKGRIVPIEVRKKISIAHRGNRSHRWQGGITPILETERRRIEFRLWREAVFSRDNWTCQQCKQRGGKLRAHHIKSFAKYPELRFAIDNGITLCEKCHFKTDNYGGKSKDL